MNAIGTIVEALAKEKAALNKLRKSNGGEHTADTAAREAAIFQKARGELEALARRDPDDVYIQASLESVTAGAIEAANNAALLRIRDRENEPGYEIRQKIAEVFGEMEGLRDAAKAGDAAACIWLRDLSIKGGTLAEVGAECFPKSLYNFSALALFCRQSAEEWSAALPDEARVERNDAKN